MVGRLKTAFASVAIAAFACSTAGTVRAESELRQAFSLVPGRMLLTKGDSPSYLNLRAWRQVAGDDVKAPEWRNVSVNLGDTFRAYQLNTDKSWQDRTGSSRDELASFVAYGEPPARVLLWRFGDPEKAAAFVAGLGNHGFKNQAGPWRNGEPKAFNLARRNPLDPFLGAMGQASMIMSARDGVAQSAQPEAALEAGSVKSEQSLAAQAPIAASLDAIEAAVGSGLVMQAQVLSPADWNLVAPADLILADAGQDMKKLAEKFADNAKQPVVQPALGAILVDVEKGSPAARGAILALPYGDCKTAEQAGKLFDERWRTARTRDGKTAAEATGVSPSISIAQANGACTVSISMMRLAQTAASIPMFGYIVRAINRRDFQPL